MPYPLLEAGMTPEEGKVYLLIETFMQDFTIVRDPYVVERVVNEDSGMTELVEKKVAEGPMLIRGVFQCENKKNANKRIYPTGLWERHIKEGSALSLRIKERACTGEIEHPKSGASSAANAAILTTKLTMGKTQPDGSRPVIGEAEVLSTPMGRIIRDLLRDRVKIGISSRGTGQISAEGVVDEKTFTPITWDIVSNPSTPGAYPTLVSEMLESENELAQTNTEIHSYLDSEGKRTWNWNNESTGQQHSITLEQSHGVTGMASKQVLKALKTSCESLVEALEAATDSTNLQKLDESFEGIAEQASELAKDLSVKSSADLLLNEVQEARKEIAERKRSQKKSALNRPAVGKMIPSSGSKAPKNPSSEDVEEPVEADAVEGDETDENVDIDTLMSQAADNIEALMEENEELKQKLEAADALSKELAEHLEMAEKCIDLFEDEYTTSISLIRQITSRNVGAVGSIAEAIDNAIEKNAALASVRPILEKCETQAELDLAISNFGGSAGKSRTDLPPVNESINSSDQQATTNEGVEKPPFAAFGTVADPVNLAESLINRLGDRRRGKLGGPEIKQQLNESVRNPASATV